MLNPDQLHGYQNAMIDRLYENDHTLIIADMGSGKTPATLTAIQELLDAGELKRVLVLAPLRVAQTIWTTEVDNWSHLNMSIVRAIGTPAARILAFESEAQVVVMNYENILWLTGRDGEDKEGNKIWIPGAFEEVKNDWVERLGFDGLVFDEVSRMKGAHKSKRYKALKPVLKRFNWIAGLTGTPAPNGLLDLYGVTYSIDQGEALGRTFTKFKEKFFFPVDPHGWKWEPKPNAEEHIYQHLASVAYVLNPADYDTRPEPTFTDHWVKQSIPSIEMSINLITDFITDTGEGVVTAANGGVLTNKLQQLSQGFLYREELSTVAVDAEKINECVEIVKSLNGNPTIIAYKYKEDLRRLQTAFPDAPNLGSGVSATKGDLIIQQWNEGIVPVMLLHPASAGHGLNLQDGGHHMIWYSLTWSSEEYRQAIARIARQGQKNHVYIHRIRNNSAIDQKMIDSMNGKISTEMDLVRGLLEK